MGHNSLRPEESMDEIILRHEDRIYRTALAILGNKSDAEDIVQETFLKLFLHNPEFQSEEHRKAWLIRVTVNLCRSRLRLAWYRTTVSLLESIPAHDDDAGDLVDAVMALPPKYRTVIHLYYYEGYSTAEIGELTGQRASTVRSLLSRARQKLKLLMEDDCSEGL